MAEYLIKHTGLMFKSEMILAYIADRKNQTRRARGLEKINQNPEEWELLFTPHEPGTRFVSFAHKVDKSRVVHINMPYGGIGDTLYFKETWKMWERPEDGKDFLHYRADDAKVDPAWWAEEEWTRPDPVWAGKFEKWQPSMFMPKICSRFRNIPIVDVRVERLLSITEEDAKGEGWHGEYEESNNSVYKRRSQGWSSFGQEGRIWYLNLWDKINGKTIPASKKPYVWVYRFAPYSKVMS